MAERDFKDFEINFEAAFKKLDEKITVPEIPDVQNIFEKAESVKTNVVPFKKYSRYVAVAAAVVLICVSIPLISPALSAEMAPQEPMEAPKIFDYYTADSLAEETVIETEVCPEEPCEAEAEDSSEIYDSNSSVAGTVTEEVRPFPWCLLGPSAALRPFPTGAYAGCRCPAPPASWRPSRAQGLPGRRVLG